MDLGIPVDPRLLPVGVKEDIEAAGRASYSDKEKDRWRMKEQTQLQARRDATDTDMRDQNGMKTKREESEDAEEAADSQPPASLGVTVSGQPKKRRKAARACNHCQTAHLTCENSERLSYL